MTRRRARCRSTRACAGCAARPARRSRITVIRGSAADPHVIELTREACRRRPTSAAGLPRRASAISVSRPSARAPLSRPRRGSPDLDQRRRGEADRRRPPRVRRLARRRHRAGEAVRRQRHADDPRKRAAADKVTIDGARAGDGSDHAADRRAHRHRHVGRRGALRGGAARKQARRIDRRAAPIGRAALAEAGSACRTAAASWLHDDAVPHAGRRAAARERPGADRRRRRTGRRVRPAGADDRPDPRQGARAARARKKARNAVELEPAVCSQHLPEPIRLLLWRSSNACFCKM